MVVILLPAITYEWWILDNPISRYLGQISYSVCLWQFVGIRAATAISDRLRLPFGFRELTVLLAVIAIAAASNRWIERPAQRWLKKRLEAKRAPAATPSPDYPLSTAT